MSLHRLFFSPRFATSRLPSGVTPAARQDAFRMFIDGGALHKSHFEIAEHLRGGLLGVVRKGAIGQPNTGDARVRE